MNSTDSSSVSYKTHDLPVGYVFNPDEDEIYSYFIPNRILEARPMHGVEELDLYDKSPDALFGERDPRKHIYLFTRLRKEKETHTRIKRTTGGGTWLGQKPTPCRRVFNGGEEITIGTMRQFTYKGGKQEWIMHEYCIEDNFLNYKINGRTNLPNPENIVFCHIYNKKAKKDSEIRRNNEELNQQKKRTRNFNNYEDSHENVNGIINNVSSVQKQEENTMLMTNYNNVPQPLLPEPLPEPQAYDRSNVDQAPPLAPQGEDDFMQDFMMENFDKMSLPENADVIKDFMGDYGNGDNNGYIVQEPAYYPSLAETYNEVGNDGFSLADLLNY